MRCAETRVHEPLCGVVLHGRAESSRAAEAKNANKFRRYHDLRDFRNDLLDHSVLGHISGCWVVGDLALAPSDAHDNSARFLKAASGSAREVQVLLREGAHVEQAHRGEVHRRRTTPPPT